MAGPTAEVLASRFSEEDRSWLADLLRSISTEVSGEDFYVFPERLLGHGGHEARAFLWTLRQGEGIADDAEQIWLAFGFHPIARIGYAAMSNQPIDHRILARLCELTARRLEGVVDFHGRLGEPFFSIPLEGTLIEINGRHVGTPDFLREFSSTPRFRMIK